MTLGIVLIPDLSIGPRNSCKHVTSPVAGDRGDQGRKAAQRPASSRYAIDG